MSSFEKRDDFTPGSARDLASPANRATPRRASPDKRAAVIMRTPISSIRAAGNLPRADLQPSAHKAVSAGKGSPSTPRTSAESAGAGAGRGGPGDSSSGGGTPRTPTQGSSTGPLTPGDSDQTPTTPALSNKASSDTNKSTMDVSGMIWGTSIMSEDAARDFGSFIRDFKPTMEKLAERRDGRDAWQRSAAEGELPEHLSEELDELDAVAIAEESPYYISVLMSLLDRPSGEGLLNVGINARHLLSFGEIGSRLYTQLTRFPSEIIPLMDMRIQGAFVDMLNERRTQAGQPTGDEEEGEREAPRLRVKVFNLQKTHRMRELDPNEIDTLIAIRGMVIRTNSVVPDMKVGYFKCSLCAYGIDVRVLAGRLEDPATCDHCGERRTMELVHNRCVYVDKQLIKVQETPDSIPEGETPLTLQVFAYEDMVDSVLPGDRVVITGVFKANGIRLSSRARTLRSVFATYIDTIHFSKNDKDRMTSEGADARSNEHAATFKLTTEVEKRAAEEKEDRVLAMSQEESLYSRLAHSLAPSIWELEDVKKGVLLQLFGGCNKDLGSLGKIRGEVNVLLCGDPGTAKSQLLSYVHRIAPRGMYTSGTGSSAVGLTAYITKDPETKEPVLESGALVLSDRGVCCIDEFDKMSDSTRSILHEVMEQQTVSIAKAGIIATLNARTSILASANPKESRYNPAESVVENLQLPPTLLSRFDLIYLILDRVDRTSDARLAGHLVSLHWPEHEREAAAAEKSQSASTFTRAQVMEYISHAKAAVNPTISEAAMEALVAGYLAMRRAGTAGGRKTISATTRQLESLIRLSEGHARMRLAPIVEEADVHEAIRLMNVSTHTAAVDPRTGTIDMNLIATGHAAGEADAVSMLASALRDMFAESQRKKYASLGEVEKAFALYTSSAGGNEPQPSSSTFKSALAQLAEESNPTLSYNPKGREVVRLM